MAYINLGNAYARLGRHKDAMGAYKQAHRIKPESERADFKFGNAQAHYNLGIALLALGSSSAAMKQYKILKTLDKELANELFNRLYK